MTLILNAKHGVCELVRLCLMVCRISVFPASGDRYHFQFVLCLVNTVGSWKIPKLFLVLLTGLHRGFTAQYASISALSHVVVVDIYVLNIEYLCPTGVS